MENENQDATAQEEEQTEMEEAQMRESAEPSTSEGAPRTTTGGDVSATATNVQEQGQGDGGTIGKPPRKKRKMNNAKCWKCGRDCKGPLRFADVLPLGNVFPGSSAEHSPPGRAPLATCESFSDFSDDLEDAPATSVDRHEPPAENSSSSEDGRPRAPLASPEKCLSEEAFMEFRTDSSEHPDEDKSSLNNEDNSDSLKTPSVSSDNLNLNQEDRAVLAKAERLLVSTDSDRSSQSNADDCTNKTSSASSSPDDLTEADRALHVKLETLLEKTKNEEDSGDYEAVLWAVLSALDSRIPPVEGTMSQGASVSCPGNLTEEYEVLLQELMTPLDSQETLNLTHEDRALLAQTDLALQSSSNSSSQSNADVNLNKAPSASSSPDVYSEEDRALHAKLEALLGRSLNEEDFGNFEAVWGAQTTFTDRRISPVEGSMSSDASLSSPGNLTEELKTPLGSLENLNLTQEDRALLAEIEPMLSALTTSTPAASHSSEEDLWMSFLCDEVLSRPKAERVLFVSPEENLPTENENPLPDTKTLEDVPSGVGQNQESRAPLTELQPPLSALVGSTQEKASPPSRDGSSHSSENEPWKTILCDDILGRSKAQQVPLASPDESSEEEKTLTKADIQTLKNNPVPSTSGEGKGQTQETRHPLVDLGTLEDTPATTIGSTSGVGRDQETRAPLADLEPLLSALATSSLVGSPQSQASPPSDSDSDSSVVVLWSTSLCDNTLDRPKAERAPLTSPDREEEKTLTDADTQTLKNVPVASTSGEEGESQTQETRTPFADLGTLKDVPVATGGETTSTLVGTPEGRASPPSQDGSSHSNEKELWTTILCDDIMARPTAERAPLASPEESSEDEKPLTKADIQSGPVASTSGQTKETRTSLPDLETLVELPVASASGVGHHQEARTAPAGVRTSEDIPVWSSDDEMMTNILCDGLAPIASAEDSVSDAD